MTRFSEPQILAILRQAESGVRVAELCREHGMSKASFYKWRAKYGGMDASMSAQAKALEDESRRLKKMFTELSRLRLRGPNGANDEFLLAATAQNLRKLAKIFPAPQKSQTA